jgi:transposase
VATHLATGVGRTGPGGPHRLVARPDRLVVGPGGFGGAQTGPNPTDRGKSGSKRHLVTDAKGTPLAIVHTGANCHDSNMAIPLIDAIPPIKRPHGRPRRRPDKAQADRGYDYDQKIRQPLRQRGIEPVIARKNTEHGSGLGVHRWYVEAAHSWLFLFRRLRVRYEKRDDIHQAFLILGCILICWCKIQRFC